MYPRFGANLVNIWSFLQAFVLGGILLEIECLTDLHR